MKRSVKATAAKVLLRHPRLAGLYYAARPGVFGGEMGAVVAGRIRYELASDSGAGNRYLLRRNVHRLEKALIMRPRRGSFATGYVGETTAQYRRLAASVPEPAADRDLLWARDVLTAYFAVVEVPEVAEARERFDRVQLGDQAELGEADPVAALAPFSRDLSRRPVSFDALSELVRSRRSTRWFLDKPVDRAAVDAAVELAAQAPTACNRQPYTFVLLDDSPLRQQVAELPLGTAGWAQNVPTLAVVVGHLDAYYSERDRHAIYIDSSLAVMQFVLGCEAQGLATCCINWPDIPELEARMRDLLHLDTSDRVVMLVAVGHPDPDGLVPFSQKRGLDTIRSYV